MLNENPGRDRSNGYEEIAARFIAGRGRSSSGVGVSVVAGWSRTLRPGAAILDVGCGTGMPVSAVLIEQGFSVYGVDASPTMVRAFRERFPAVPVQCAAAEESDFFGREFDGVVSWGLLFLLDGEDQRKLIAKMSGVLRPGGRMLFTAVEESCSWNDAMTGRTSISLGREGYEEALTAAGMSLVGTACDEGRNFYLFAEKR